jgi:DNA repair photolyase
MKTDDEEYSSLPDPALFAGLPDSLRARFVTYFYTRPRGGEGCPKLRAHVLALYNPTAKRSRFPAGIRLCANVYVGCSHRCLYAYEKGYIPNPDEPRIKKDFLIRAREDLMELRELGAAPVPLHISNSTDPFQETMEGKHRHTLQLMELVAADRQLFTSVTFLTKNALLAAQPAYLSLLKALLPCQVEVSVTFADEGGRELFEPGAPRIASRLEGIRRLRKAGVPVSMRVDPLFPREPLPARFWPSPRLRDYGVERTHSLDEIESLIAFASSVGCQKIVVSPLKVPVGRWASHKFKEMFRSLYGAPFGGKPKTRSFAWRLPEPYVHDLMGEVRKTGWKHDVPIVTCWDNLINTK